MPGLLNRLSMLSLVTAFAAAAPAGELDPPIGPVSPTMKPLDLVEARTALTPGTTPGDANNIYIITQPGSYYLIDNLTENQGENGILVQASNVQIDLNGFRIRGGNTGGAKGIFVSTNLLEGVPRDQRAHRELRRRGDRPRTAVGRRGCHRHGLRRRHRGRPAVARARLHRHAVRGHGHQRG